MQRKVGVQFDGKEENDVNRQVDIDYEKDPMVVSLLNKVHQFRLGQTLDEVKGSAQILSGIAVPPTQQQAVVVKYIFVDEILKYGLHESKNNEDKNQDNGGNVDEKDNEKKGNTMLSELEFEDIDKCAYLATFKVYQNTTFDHIKTAACKYWNLESRE